MGTCWTGSSDMLMCSKGSAVQPGGELSNIDVLLPSLIHARCPICYVLHVPANALPVVVCCTTMQQLRGPPIKPLTMTCWQVETQQSTGNRQQPNDSRRQALHSIVCERTRRQHSSCMARQQAQLHGVCKATGVVGRLAHHTTLESARVNYGRLNRKPKQGCTHDAAMRC
jgi:hypothetical protein